MNDWSWEVKKQEKSMKEYRNFKIKGTHFVLLLTYHKILGTRDVQKHKPENGNTEFLSFLDYSNGFLNGLLTFMCFLF